MPYAKVNDINMYYEIHGEGEPLVFILGLSGRTDEWGSQVQVYSQDYQLVVFDNRGAGRTDAPDIPYTIDMFASDVAGLLDSIGIAKAHIRGVSAGGLIVQQFALLYPDRVISLILQGTTCGGENAQISPDAFSFYLDEEMTQEQRVTKLIWLVVTDDFANKNPDVIQQIRNSLADQDFSAPGAFRQIKAFQSADIYDRLPEIQAPTLVLGAGADRVMPPEHSKIMASRIPNAELVILKNTGHMFLEAGGENYRIILDFLKRHSNK